eukprot:14098038-Alexandrium_andersonii.AAC.1
MPERLEELEVDRPHRHCPGALCLGPSRHHCPGEILQAMALRPLPALWALGDRAHQPRHPEAYRTGG